MSILNGDIHSSLIHTLPDSFGFVMEEMDYVPLDAGMEVIWKSDDAVLFAGCREKLIAYKLQEGKLIELSALSLWGSIRQCALNGNLLAATAREEGVYLIDVSNPCAMRLLKRLDTLELATGVCLYGNLCLITNRHAGIEVWDVSSPSDPRYLSSFLCGEAQSVFMDRHCAYVGDWMNQKLHIIDLSTPEQPIKLAEVCVDGFADGVWVEDGKCYVATGHNSRLLKNRTAYWQQSYVTPQMLNDGFGCGHGLSCFDVSDPAHPEFISRLAFPPLFTGHPDTWRVTVSGRFAYCADTNNGVFVVDISDPFQMKITAHRKLGLLPPDANPLSPRYAAASAAVPGNGVVLSIGPQTGLHVLRFDEAVPAKAPSYISLNAPKATPEPFFVCKGPVHALVSWDERLIAACGSDGLYILSEDGKILNHKATANAVLDVQLLPPYLLSAEGCDGIGVYLLDATEGFRFIKHLCIPHASVRQLAVSMDYNCLALEIGTSRIAYVNHLIEAVESNASTLSPVTFVAHGPLYSRHLVSPFFKEFFAAMPLTSGYTWFRVDKEQVIELPFACDHECCPIEEGIAVGHDLIYAVNRKHLYILRHPSDALDETTHVSVPGAKLTGQPQVCGSKLLLLNRIHQTVECLDITSPSMPVQSGTWRVPGPPLHAIEHNGIIFLACGHAGLVKLHE